MDFDLERFITAQDANDSYETALKELENGEKESHWMWYVFPQMRGLGRSEMAQKFGISSIYEAYAYLNHEVLRERLYKAVRTLNDNYGRDIEYVLGDIDALKLKSSLTLFDAIAPDDEFDRALRYFYDEERDQITLNMIAQDKAILDEDVWEKFNVKVPERAFFDGGCHETERLSSEERRATFMDLFKRGYSVVTLTWQYLIGHRDLFDNYRTSNTESTLTSIGFYLLLSLYEWLDNQVDPSPLTQLASLYPLGYFEYEEGMTWETSAYRLDALFKFMLENPKLADWMESQISTYSLLR